MENNHIADAGKKVRLIDANAMREDWLENGENEYVYDTNTVLASIDAQPTVEALIPPVKPWDKVWVLSKTLDDKARFKPLICEGEIVSIKYNGFTTPMEWIEYRYETPVFGQTVVYDRIDLCLGKKVFLSREEAEKALEEMKDND